MIEQLLSLADRFSRLVGWLAMLLIAALVVSMFYEVVARYGFNAPTVWSYDVSYMLNGTIFLLGAGLALSKNLHVRIDFLSSRFPVRVQHAINLIFYLVLFLPVFGIVGHQATTKAWKAFITGELEPVSPWAPVIWPFYAGLALGLICLLLQAVAEAIRHGIGIAQPDRVRTPAEQDAH